LPAGAGDIELPDVEQALAEMLFSGGSLNLKLLGAEGADGTAGACESMDGRTDVEVEA
jgi:hypothetical protein